MNSICHTCNKNFLNPLNLEYHSRTCKLSNNFKNKVFFWLKCENAWDNETSYFNHFKFCCKYLCFECNIPFLTVKALNYHISHHIQKQVSS